jgi:hypothetical protein
VFSLVLLAFDAAGLLTLVISHASTLVLFVAYGIIYSKLVVGVGTVVCNLGLAAALFQQRCAQA